MSGAWRRSAAAAGLWALIGTLYLGGLDACGLLGPDEPRYASIAREMASSGDWITPRLWNEPWFEKPPLTYWLIGAAFLLGLGEDLAPRLPLALCSLLFLAWYLHALTKEFGRRAAVLASLMLATCAGWVAYSRVGVTDLPLAAAFSAAMLLALPWLVRGETRGLSQAAALFGLAVLAKGLVAAALALPLFWMGRRRLGDWLRPGPLVAFLLIAAPWYLAVSLLHGRTFLEEFFLEHHLQRLYADRLQHVQPFWFYVPVLAVGLLPWTPLAALAAGRRLYEDARMRFLLAWVLWGLVFFSLARNKLPGYLLPLLPAVCALLALGLERAQQARWALSACAALLALVPAAAAVLPSALLVGIRKASWPEWSWGAVAAVIPLAIVCWWQAPQRRHATVAAIAAATAVALIWMMWRTLPVLDRVVSVRSFWRHTGGTVASCCVESEVDRDRRYGLNYYSGRALPPCLEAASPVCRVRVARDGRLEQVER
ncbi:MAG: glycosyltransferase family 39 protein [Bryobacterales bacterium]|nr:glycosyltransferase family 39 protein [Bryobacteraceae bacterium]MDW8129186.1 glycosyltransferase family 39 protein [Bryobacterales bacterium]